MPKLTITVETIDGSNVYRESMSVNVDKDNKLTSLKNAISDQAFYLAKQVIREVDPSII